MTNQQCAERRTARSREITVRGSASGRCGKQRAAEPAVGRYLPSSSTGCPSTVRSKTVGSAAAQSGGLASGRCQRNRGGLELAARSTELVRLWRSAAALHRDSVAEPASASASAAQLERSWEELVLAIRPFLKRKVRTAIRRLKAHQCDHAEIIQEIYVRLLSNGARAMRQFKGTHDLQLVKYLGRVSDSIVVDAHRRSRAIKRGRHVLVTVGPGSVEGRADSLPNPEERYRCRSELVAFRRAVKRCAAERSRKPARTCRIFEEVIVHGSDGAALANELGLSPSSVNSVVSRMRQNLLEDGWEVARRPPVRARNV